MKEYELKEKLNDITKKDFIEAIALAMNGSIETIAPLGFSGKPVILFGKQGSESGSFKRESIVSFRNYCNNTEFLITDKVGNFLFYGKIDDRIGKETVLDFYWNTFQTLKPFIEKEMPKREIVNDMEKAKKSSGWDMLLAFYKEKENE